MATIAPKDPRDRIIDLLLKRQRQLLRLVTTLHADISALQEQLRQANEREATSCVGESGRARSRKAIKSGGRARS